MAPSKLGLLERLNKGNVVVGDGGFVFAMEKRGYVKAGIWTPEVSVEHPEALRQLHREFLRAGAHVMQTFTFYASDDKLDNFGNTALQQHTGSGINDAACRIAREVADEGGALVAGGISQTPSYLTGAGKAAVQAEFKKQIDVFVKHDVDFLIAEYFEHVEETEWAIEVCKQTGKPVMATISVAHFGDCHGVSAGDIAVRMVKAGADVVGVNCHFGPFEYIKMMEIMKESLDAAGLKAHLACQPLGYHTPDCGTQGFLELPEFPFALEPRTLTRWEVRKWARKMYDLGVRYIGGCCGFEPYHIRAICEELQTELGGGLPAASDKHDIDASGLRQHTKPWVRARGRAEYWQNLAPATGRVYSSALAPQLDKWGVTQGDKDLTQQKMNTTEKQYDELVTKQFFHRGETREGHHQEKK